MRDKDLERDEFDPKRCKEYLSKMRGVILELNSWRGFLDILS